MDNLNFSEERMQVLLKFIESLTSGDYSVTFSFSESMDFIDKVAEGIDQIVGDLYI